MNLIKKVGGSVVEVSCKLSQSDQITNIFRKKMLIEFSIKKYIKFYDKIQYALLK